jgi:TusA-related sulfurtransferase
VTIPTAGDAVIEGGDLDCGSGLLILIRQEMSPLQPGQVLEIRSREISVREDLPAWCRLAGHSYEGEALLAGRPDVAYFVTKGDPSASQEADLAEDLERAKSYEWVARVRWQGALQARVYARNHAFEVGQPASFAETDPALSAVEYLLGAFGACLVVGFAANASRRGVLVDDLEFSLRGKLQDPLVLIDGSDGSPALESIRGTLYVTANADYTTLREIWQTTLARSPLAATLGPVVNLDLKLSALD